MISLLLLPLLAVAATTPCAPFPSSAIPFSSGFEEPLPPRLQPEFNASFVQHKWNKGLSHITAGYMVNSPSGNFVRAGEAFEGGIATSLFNYGNVTEDGLVDNILTTYEDGSPATIPTVWRGYVNSNFPLFDQDILVQTAAVFGGLTRRAFWEEPVAAWNIMYQGVVPVTVYVTNCGVMAGYDYFSPAERTRVVTEYLNVQVAGP